MCEQLSPVHFLYLLAATLPRSKKDELSKKRCLFCFSSYAHDYCSSFFYHRSPSFFKCVPHFQRNCTPNSTRLAFNLPPCNNNIPSSIYFSRMVSPHDIWLATLLHTCPMLPYPEGIFLTRIRSTAD